MSARIITLSGTPYPKAEIQTVSAAHGTATFRWLDANSVPVDSGGSIARFTPLEATGAPPVYPDVSDATLQAAIQSPPAAPVEVPATVTRRQLLLALNASGITRAAIRMQIGANEAALIEFDEASTFDRAHPLVASLASALGLTSTQVDNLYRAAAAL